MFVPNMAQITKCMKTAAFMHVNDDQDALKTAKFTKTWHYFSIKWPKCQSSTKHYHFFHVFLLFYMCDIAINMHIRCSSNIYISCYYKFVLTEVRNQLWEAFCSQFETFWFYRVQNYTVSLLNICRKFEFLISQDSVATCLRWGEYHHMGFVANFIRFPTVQKFWKSVKIW